MPAPASVQCNQTQSAARPQLREGVAFGTLDCPVLSWRALVLTLFRACGKCLCRRVQAEGNALKAQEAADMVVLYDSLQLEHKCILNYFYG